MIVMSFFFTSVFKFIYIFGIKLLQAARSDKPKRSFAFLLRAPFSKQSRIWIRLDSKTFLTWMIKRDTSKITKIIWQTYFLISLAYCQPSLSVLPDIVKSTFQSEIWYTKHESVKALGIRVQRSMEVISWYRYYFGFVVRRHEELLQHSG